MILRRDRRMPAVLAAHLAEGDRALASAELTDGAWAAVARGALVVIEEAGVRSRSPWHDVDRGSWDGDTETLTVTWVDGRRAPMALTLADAIVAERFTRALRERIQSSVVHNETTELPGGAVASATIRRDEDGRLFSQLTARGRLREDDEERRLLDDLERRARAAVGLTT